MTVELREIREADVPTLFAHQADPEANAMAAFPARDEPAFREHLARVFADPANIIRGGGVRRGARGGDRELGRRGRAQGRLLDRPRALGQRVRNGGAHVDWSRSTQHARCGRTSRTTTWARSASSSGAASCSTTPCRKTSWSGSTCYGPESVPHPRRNFNALVW